MKGTARAVGRLMVATAAGAGLGAGAALYRRHLLNESPPGRQDDRPETDARSSEPVPGAAPTPSATTGPNAEDIAALQASVADLEAARARLRERAAALRAEMEGSGH